MPGRCLCGVPGAVCAVRVCAGVRFQPACHPIEGVFESCENTRQSAHWSWLRRDMADAACPVRKSGTYDAWVPGACRLCVCSRRDVWRWRCDGKAQRVGPCPTPHGTAIDVANAPDRATNATAGEAIVMGFAMPLRCASARYGYRCAHVDARTHGVRVRDCARAAVIPRALTVA
jgi:hypothetical protein